ncbi:DNA-binding transcriptional regulator [Microbacterium sp.]|uniref:AraC family transcriptional regulator n=1 Tax=Microbacterium sp. TaxID=51671 RepID=UPI00092685EE|nr:DNA-binding transcriptional regulator [Microbacterium sp.]MBN9193557.1 DNA-binding transcriptional regulator [Microbacterium sp.]OJU57947.1 MAG: XylR family transcriptional regulator [Microbacterium sp. 70-38]
MHDEGVNASPPSATRHVALLVETSNAYGRGLLLGVRNFLATGPGWSIYLGEHGRHDTDLSWLDSWRGDGVIARIENRQTADHVRRLGVPTVDLSAARLAPEFPGVETDDDVIARWAVDHLSERGLRHFAYCGDSRFAWSVNRGARFAAHVAARQGRSAEFSIEPSGRLASDRIALADWLRALPKPVGILACYDIAGQEVLEACRIAGLEVPDEVAVIGVDNDELMCNLTSPPLSSIQSDAIGAGMLAASMLDDMMNGVELPPELRLMEPLRVVTRQSSDLRSVSDPLVAKAMQLIRDRADEGITVVAVQRAVGLSRRSLDYRFVAMLGRSVHEEITRVRLERVADLLVETDWTLSKIAERLNFSHSEYMGVAFKRVMGRSPGEYRRANRGRAIV